MRKDQLLKQLETFMKQKSALSSDHGAGLVEDYKIEEIYKKYSHLFTQENCDKIFMLLTKEEDVLERRKLLYLFSTLLGYRLEMLDARLVEEMENYETKAMIEFEGKEVPFRQVAVLIANEENREKRKELYDKSTPHILKLTEYEKKLMNKELALYRKYGFDYIRFFETINEVDLRRLAEIFRKFLVETEEKYVELMKDFMRPSNVPYGDWKSYDLSIVMRAKKFDHFFPKENAFPVLKETLGGMGFDLKIQDNIKVDIEEREKKDARAYCASVEVPQDIRLVVKPVGGIEDYDAMLHESGHAEHYANTDPSLPIEFKYLGDSAHSELYSYLFDHLTMNRSWLRKFTTMSDADIDAYLRHMLTQTLFFIRRYFAKVLYELKFYSKDLRRLDGKFHPINGQNYVDMGECYEDILSRATKVEYHRTRYAMDMDGGFYSAGYSRAWLAEAMVRNKLVESFGENWFEKKEAGEFLKKLYVNGDKIKIEDAVALAGCGVLAINALENDFKGL